MPTITLIHLSVIPVLAGDGTIFVDNRAHKTIYDGCQFASARGATVKRFRFEDPDDLEQLLRQDRSTTRLICMDGVNSMTGNAPDLNEFARLARRYDAMLYVDDAHGFGVIGERSRTSRAPTACAATASSGTSASPTTTIVLVGGFSKSYSSLAAFVACPTELKRAAQDGGPAVSVLGAVAGRLARDRACRLRRQRGPRRRDSRGPLAQDATRCSTASIDSESTRRTVPAFRSSRFRSPATRTSTRSGRFLFDHGVYVTLAAYPLVPKSEVGFRIQVTAANSQAEIEQLIDVLGKLAERVRSPARPKPRNTRRDHSRRHRLARPTPGSCTSRVGGVLTAAYLWFPPLKGERPADQLARPVVVGRDRGRHLPAPTEAPRGLAALHPRPVPVLRRRPLHVQLPEAVRRRRRRSRRSATGSTCCLPGADGGAVPAGQAPEPASATRRRGSTR